MKLPKFVVQEHHARKLHYDFRLQIGSILRSWAIPKTPPLIESEKRLAVQVDNHPLSFLKFEGRIPEGLYGEGKIIIWDKGSYLMEKEDKDKIIFDLHGKKMNGKYCLLKFKKGNKQWLIFKVKK